MKHLGDITKINGVAVPLVNVIIGRLTADPELRQTQSGAAVYSDIKGIPNLE